MEAVFLVWIINDEHHNMVISDEHSCLYTMHFMVVGGTHLGDVPVTIAQTIDSESHLLLHDIHQPSLSPVDGENILLVE